MQYSKTKNLTPATQKFIEVVARTDNATQAVREAYPDLAAIEKVKKAGGEDYPYLQVKANRLITNDNISKQITHQKNKLATIANRAVDRVQELVESDNEKIATQNIWQVIDHVHGKAVQQIETTNQSLVLSIDLTSALDDVQQG